MSLGHTTYTVTQKITDTADDCMKYLHSLILGQFRDYNIFSEISINKH